MWHYLILYPFIVNLSLIFSHHLMPWAPSSVIFFRYYLLIYNVAILASLKLTEDGLLVFYLNNYLLKILCWVLWQVCVVIFWSFFLTYFCISNSNFLTISKGVLLGIVFDTVLILIHEIFGDKSLLFI